jgi:chemotaxis family two-component system response regulator Rcp1
VNSFKKNNFEILLAEDNKVDIAVVKESLKEVFTLNNLSIVENGEDAIKYLKKEDKYRNMPRPDIIILDLNLPKYNGRDILTKIKNDDDLKSIPIIVLTTSDDENDILDTYNLHANCYIIKPVEFRKFEELLKQVLNFWFNVVQLPKAKQ